LHSSPVADGQLPVTPVLVRPDIFFEYIGETGLSVKGYNTGKLYRFNFKGDIQPVDFRDANSMVGIPVLRKRL